MAKHVVVGAGAMGSLVAGCLANAGEDVALIARGPRASFLAERGITVKGRAEFSVNVPIIERPEELHDCDVLVLTTKTYSTQAALGGVAHLHPELALSVQNGVVKNEHLAAVFGWDHTAGCAAQLSAEVLEDGTVLFPRDDGFSIGELPSGTSARTLSFADALKRGGMNAEATGEVRSIEWSKYLAWLPAAAGATLTRMYAHEFFQDPDIAVLLMRITREAVDLSKAVGVELLNQGGAYPMRSMAEAGPDEQVEMLREAGARMEANGAVTIRVSILVDLLRGRQLEVEDTFGYAVKKAEELGVAVPTIETCYRLLSGINRSLAAPAG